ncbi:extracellular endo-alpha-(1-_5)-L-arabinanase 1 [Bacillus subtilis]|nr:hypothetical protein BSNT_09302 [Bacillus subtilis subsp. natto BEST195]BCV76160.1 hypothetical protein BsBEST3096_29620 [Bacillus subtilis]BDB94044.1 hypothetical protein BSG8_27960 [Bacillus subtilis subsp. natto]GAK79943.1 hypothetical protein BSMD_018510 [Bacillus subtilis Miyagi-4]BCV80391.1 hypothetical protein BsBEST3102_29510 [Bacillus subtilis]
MKKKKTWKRFLHFSSAALAAGLIFTSAAPAEAAFWGASNELLHDPTMIKEGSSWYALGTGLTEERGLRVLKSSDAKNWTVQKSIFSTPLSWWSNYVPNYGQNQWAPDI